MDSTRDYYADLEIGRTDSQDAIQQAYRRLAKKHHPDCAGSEGAGRFRLIQEAYEVLSDPRLRAQYDDARPARRARRPNHPEPMVKERPRAAPEPFTAPRSDSFGSRKPQVFDSVRPEIYEFARLAEHLLSPVLLSPRLSDDETYLIRLYLHQLLDRFGT
ncbi:MAG TPA: DnaJ domain-containing protein [Nitrospiraceae bacterium]|nr:DnaJ domain-containing protein [Nitrospiraceae bacterium]